MPTLVAHIRVARLVDPALLLVIALGGALAASRMRAVAASPAKSRWAARCVWAAWACLWIASTPAFAYALAASVRLPTTDLGAALAGTKPSDVAIAVFGGGAGGNAPTPRERLSGACALRVIAAARVWADTHAAIVVATGSPEEAEAMADLLVALGVPDDRVVRDGTAANTHENARNSAAIFRERGLGTAIVVTTDAHLRRSVRDFSRAGVRALSVPGGGTGRPTLDAESFLPSALALGETHIVLHEIVGYLR